MYNTKSSFAKSKLTYQNKQGSRSQSNFTFTPTQILTNQILKVLKLRLRIANIHISEENLIELIKDNLSLIDIQYFKVSSLSIFVDDLMDIIKKDSQQQQLENEKTLDESKPNTLTRTTILSFKRKVYDDTHKVPLSERNSKFKKAPLVPMKFTLDNRAKPDEFDFYLDEKQEITTLNDCDLEDVQEKIIAEVAKDSHKDNHE